MNRQVSDDDLKLLRLRGQIENFESAVCEGDLVLAVNVTTGTRRILGQLSELLTSSSRKLLLD